MSEILKNSFFPEKANSDAFARRELGLIVAQTAWGEDIIRPLLKKLMTYVDDPLIKNDLILQMDDEHRHTKLYWNHIHALDSGISRKLSPLYLQVYDDAMGSESPFELLACILVCLESFAFGAFNFRRQVCSYSPTLQLDTEVEVDEWRHIDTGVKTLNYLLQEGFKMDREKVIDRVRKINLAFMSRSFVEDLEYSCGEQTKTPTAESSLMRNYYLMCHDEFSQKLKKFLAANRQHLKKNIELHD